MNWGGDRSREWTAGRVGRWGWGADRTGQDRTGQVCRNACASAWRVGLDGFSGKQNAWAGPESGEAQRSVWVRGRGSDVLVVVSVISFGFLYPPWVFVNGDS
jgi:hypothetical protein